MDLILHPKIEFWGCKSNLWLHNMKNPNCEIVFVRSASYNDISIYNSFGIQYLIENTDIKPEKEYTQTPYYRNLAAQKLLKKLYKIVKDYWVCSYKNIDKLNRIETAINTILS
jgi:hypothetical protein